MDFGNSLFYVWILYFTLTIGTQAAICFRKNLKNVLIEYCCDNYELKHGVCIKCEIGTTSSDGNGCALCPNMTYGERCSNDCKCSSMERCDKKYGCIDTNIKETWIQTTTENNSSISMATTKLTGKSQNFDEKKSVNGIFLYCLCTGGLLLLIGACYICVKYNLNRSNCDNINKNRRIINPVQHQNHTVSDEDHYTEIQEINV